MLSNQYMEEHEQCIQKLLPPEEAKSVDYDQLYKGLEVLSEFERQANSRVIDSGVLRGMNLDDIRKAGERLILQDGCRNFFKKIGETREKVNLDIHILSYCWCAELIRSAISSDVGIVVGSSTTLRRVGKQFGVSFVPLLPGLVEKQRRLWKQEASIFKARSGVLHTVSSWSEVQAFILGNDSS
ncbi:hypothetical protein ACQJBY_068502 [Aegilops geniculata]